MTEQHKQHYCYRAVRLTAAMCRLTFSRFGHYCIASSSQRVHCEVNSSIMAELILHFTSASAPSERHFAPLPFISSSVVLSISTEKHVFF